MMREHKKTISEMRSKFTERNNELVRAQDHLRTEKKQAVQAATAAAHELRRLSLLLKLSKENQAKMTGASESQQEAASISSSGGSAFTVVANEGGPDGAQQSRQATSEDDKENQAAIMLPKAPSSKKVVKLRIKLRRPLEPTSLDPIPEESQTLGGDDGCMEMEGVEVPPKSGEGGEHANVSIGEQEIFADGETFPKTLMDLEAKSLMDLDEVRPASADGDSQYRERPVHESPLPVKNHLAHAEDDSQHIAHVSSKHVTTRRGRSEDLSEGKGHNPVMVEQTVKEEVEQQENALKRTCAETFGQSAGELSRQERHRKRNRQGRVIEDTASKGKEAAEHDARAQDSHSEPTSLSAQIEMNCEGTQQEVQDQNHKPLCNMQDCLPNPEEEIGLNGEQGRPRRRQSIICYAEPSLSQKLRQGDQHTFNSGAYSVHVAFGGLGARCTCHFLRRRRCTICGAHYYDNVGDFRLVVL